MSGLLDDELRPTIECRLVTTGRLSGEPREIRIWFATAGDRVYLLSQHQERAHWVRNIAAEPQVQIRIEGRTFEGRAQLIGGTPEDTVARDAWATKYGTKYFEKFLREALPVVVDLEREIEDARR